ncbi:MAG TPA: 3-hydroxybutyryl-CoA dehydrogenase [Streptosporangiaceae bacterium]|nr:3-hydroxybutyryl-CoA dehydrogenase [Streptosporangiaceae bacterium]
MPREINSVAVVGGGLMGAGIAEVSAVAGMLVVVRDLPQYLDAARSRVEKSLAGAVKRGKIEQAKRDEVLTRITFTPDLKDVARADIVIEAVPEILDLKASLIKELDELVSPGNVIATNTSSFPIAELAARVQHPGRVVGVHFFSPVPVMKLVEIVAALDTDPETADTAFAFAERLGKHPIRAKDRSGFIVNFLLVGYVMAAIRMYEEGFASREGIDAGMRLGAGHPMGPLTVADMVGLDIVCSIGNSMYEEFKREEYAPPPLLRRMIAAGRLGRKSGQGFYEYET